jgi:hypothetical protein
MPPPTPPPTPSSPLQGSDYALRYHDLHANRFVRYFRGHTGRVTTLAMSPKSDTFLSAAEDKTVGSRSRQRACQAAAAKPVFSFWPSGPRLASTQQAHELPRLAYAHANPHAPAQPPLAHTTPPLPSTPPRAAQVRLWDLRVNGCQALLEAPGLPTTAFDEQGLVFGVGAERGVVKLYDARNWAAGPFTSFPVGDAGAVWVGGRQREGCAGSRRGCSPSLPATTSTAAPGCLLCRAGNGVPPQP